MDGVPLLVVCTARPELLERRPGWGGGKRNATTVSLAPLDDDETARLILALLGRPLLEADVQRQLVERAAGNPLYAEEFVRMLEAGGNVDGRLPETVQGIVAARIDLLPAEEKELLQQAAVLGKVFWSDALATVAGLEPWQLQDALRALERKEFIRRELRSTVAGAFQHAFQHALVRDAAYGQIPRAARAARHVSAASWIESLPAIEPRIAPRRWRTTIRQRSISIARPVRTSTLRTRAVPALPEAGERALSLSAFQSSRRFLSRALGARTRRGGGVGRASVRIGKAFGFVGRDGDELERAVDAFEQAGEPERAAERAVVKSFHLWHARPGEAHRWLARAAALVEGRPPSRAKALVLAEQARQEMLGYNKDTALELSSQAALLAAEIGDDEIRADALVTGGVVRAIGGDLAGIEMMEAALELVGHRGKVASRGYVNLFVAWVTVGDARKARSTLEQGLERAEREGDEQGAWFIRGNLLGALYAAGDWVGALELIQMFLDNQEQSGYQLNAARDTRARILEARGDAAAALAELYAVVEFAREIQDSQVLWPSLIVFAWLARRRGMHEESSTALAEVVGAIAASESPGDGQEWHIELMLGLEAIGRHADALKIAQRLPDGLWRDATMATVERRYTDAADILASIGEQPLQADLRLRAATQLVSDGRLGEAHEQLERARAFWRTVGATAFLRDADEVLAEAS